MNVERMNLLADSIEAGREDLIFHMGVWCSIDSEHTKGRCGTAGCIAGWAVFLFGSPGQIAILRDSPGWAAIDAQDLLGLDDDEAQYLFAGDFSSKDFLKDITVPEAVAAIRRMAEEYCLQEAE